MMSPPISPALSAGPSGESTESKITPASSSAVSKPLTPTYDFEGAGAMIPTLPFRKGATIAVNAAAPTKKTSNATKIQAMPLILRRRFLGIGRDPAAAPAGTCEPSNLTVSVYSATPSPRRKPQLRQNRSSAGMVDRQLAQTVTS